MLHWSRRSIVSKKGQALTHHRLISSSDGNERVNIMQAFTVSAVLAEGGRRKETYLNVRV